MDVCLHFQRSSFSFSTSGNFTRYHFHQAAFSLTFIYIVIKLYVQFHRPSSSIFNKVHFHKPSFTFLSTITFILIDHYLHSYRPSSSIFIDHYLPFHRQRFSFCDVYSICPILFLKYFVFSQGAKWGGSNAVVKLTSVNYKYRVVNVSNLPNVDRYVNFEANSQPQKRVRTILNSSDIILTLSHDWFNKKLVQFERESSY